MSGVRDKGGRKGKGENGDKKLNCLNYYRRLARSSLFAGTRLAPFALARLSLARAESHESRPCHERRAASSHAKQ